MITMIGCAKGGDNPYYSVNHDQDRGLLFICKNGSRLSPLRPFLPDEFPLCSEIVSCLAFGADFDGKLSEIRRRLES